MTDRLLIALAAIAGAMAIVMAPFEFRSAIHDAITATRLSPTERELAPEKRVGVDGAALLAAMRLIPPRATYYVNASPTDAETVRPMTFYALFPRRYVDSPRVADWVLSFGESPPKVDAHLGERIRLGPALTAARVQP
jgi:hypothetical protein